MIILPIGHEHETVRRVPWVSIAIIATNLVAFLAVGLPALHHEELVTLKAQEVFTYWQEHPYLDLPEEFLKATMTERQREDLKVATEAFKNMHPSAAEDARPDEQRRLDALVQSYFAARGESSFMSMGLVPARPRPLAILTSMFMHAGWMHLLGNMLLFYLAGLIVEDAFGRPLFAGLYLVAGVVAALAHVGAFSQSTVPLVGASGAIAGVMGAFLIRFWSTRIKFWYLFWMFLFVRTGTFTAPAWLMLPLWFLQQVFMASLVKAEGGVAYMAHIGGFAFGAAVAYVVRTFAIEEKYIHPRIEAEVSLEQDPALEEALARLVRVDLVGARQALAPLLARDPRHTDANLAMWESYVREETPEKAIANMAIVVENELKAGEIDLALEHWRELTTATRGNGPPPLAFRLASAIQDSNRSLAVEIFAAVADDAAAGVLAAKAAHRLAMLATSKEEREFWEERASLAAAGAPAATAPARPPTATPAHSTPVRPAAVAPPSAASPAAPPVPAVAVDAPAASPSPDFGDDVAAAAEPAPAPAAPFAVEACQMERLENDGVMLRGAGGASEFLPYSRVAAVAVAGVTGGAKPYLVLDVVLRPLAGMHTVLRFLSSQLDPVALTNRGDLSQLDAFRELVRRIADGAAAPTLPPAPAAGTRKLATFPSVEEYEKGVLTAFVSD